MHIYDEILTQNIEKLSNWPIIDQSYMACCIWYFYSSDKCTRCTWNLYSPYSCITGNCTKNYVFISFHIMILAYIHIRIYYMHTQYPGVEYRCLNDFADTWNSSQSITTILNTIVYNFIIKYKYTNEH